MRGEKSRCKKRKSWKKSEKFTETSSAVGGVQQKYARSACQSSHLYSGLYIRLPGLSKSPFAV